MNAKNSFLLKMAERNHLDIKVKGMSMYPTFQSGDVVRVVGFNSEPSIGDVVLYSRGNDYILHRIIFMEDEFIVTKGDNNPYADNPVHRNSLIGLAINASKKSSIEKSQNRNITVNLWKEVNNDLIASYANAMHINVVYSPNVINTNNVNIAILPTALTPITHMDQTLWHKTDIVFHMFAPISNFPLKGMVLDKRFDGVYRSGTYLSSYKLTHHEQVLILLTEIITLEAYYEARNNPEHY